MIIGRFEWDDEKAALNLVKHGVSFMRAALVFEDARALDVEDKRRDYGEERRNIIGRLPDGVVYFVSYTMREERIRIISARRAVRHEIRVFGSAGEDD